MKTYNEFLNETKSKENIESQLAEFFTNTKNIDDKKVHEFAESLGLEYSQFENYVYKELADFFQSWLYAMANKKPNIDPKQLSMGIKVEHEHVKSKLLATKIAKDHLTEDSTYYTKLKTIEK